MVKTHFREIFRIFSFTVFIILEGHSIFASNSFIFQTFHNTEASLSTLAALKVLLTTIRFSQSNFKRIEETILEFD